MITWKNLSNEALSVEMLADTMGMSTSSLYRKVKGCLSGLSPNDFIRIARLKERILLMQNGENRISEIAFQVGFFVTCLLLHLLKQYGKTPSEYLKQAERSKAVYYHSATGKAEISTLPLP